MILERLDNIVREYPGEIVALQGVSLKLTEGKVLGIVGPNGSGKTTLLRIMALLDMPTSGEVFYKGKKVTTANVETLRKNITMVFQRTTVFDTTVFKNVAYGLRLRRLPRRELESKVKQALQTVGLETFEQRPARSLSGGEQQLVAIARALVLEPELLILDEPTANLDPIHATTVERLILELRNKTTVVHSTQSVALATKLSDLIAFLHEGMLVQIGPVEEVLTKPASARIARFVGFENIFEGNIVSVKMGIVKVDVEGIEIEAVSDKRGRCTVAIRPEDVVVSKAPFESSMRNTFEGRIIRIVDIGPLIKVIVNVHGLPIAALLTRRSFQDLGLRERDNAYISFKASCVYVI